MPSTKLELPERVEQVPAPFDRQSDWLTRLVCWKPQFEGEWEITRPLTEPERERLRKRVAVLEMALTPITPEQEPTVRAAIAGMFSGFRAMRQQGEDIPSTVEVTCVVMRDLPAWAVKEACLKVARGKAELETRYAPNDTQLHLIADRLLHNHRRALHEARELLRAKVSPHREIRPVATNAGSSGMQAPIRTRESQTI